MSLFYMNKFMTDDLLQFFFGMQIAVDKNSITKGERNDVFIYLVKFHSITGESILALRRILQKEMQRIINRSSKSVAPVSTAKDIQSHLFQAVKCKNRILGFS